MAYIGNEPAARFTSIPTVQQFNGDGSTTAFTLSRTVSSDQDILVSVDGVIQDTAAYAVSSGTTLTFSAAPSTGTANIFVNHLGLTIGSVTHPPSSALAATTGTFNDDVGVGKTAVDARLDVTTAVSGDLAARFANTHSSGSFGISVAAGDDAGNYAASFGNKDGTNLLKIRGDGAVSMPLQPAFNAHPAGEQTNIAVGSAVTIVFDTERFDQGSNFASNTFTAPVTGKYQLNVALYLNNLDSASNYYELRVVTSNDIYYTIIDPDYGQDAVYYNLTHSVLADMDADDTAYIAVQQGSGTAQTDITINSFFSGFLAC